MISGIGPQGPLPSPILTVQALQSFLFMTKLLFFLLITKGVKSKRTPKSLRITRILVPGKNHVTQKLR